MKVAGCSFAPNALGLGGWLVALSWPRATCWEHVWQRPLHETETGHEEKVMGQVAIREREVRANLHFVFVCVCVCVSVCVCF